jgi:hypothetical protein
VFVEFSDVASAAKAYLVMHGREFGTQKVVASYFSLESYQAGDLGPALYGSTSSTGESANEDIKSGSASNSEPVQPVKSVPIVLQPPMMPDLD